MPPAPASAAPVPPVSSALLRLLTWLVVLWSAAQFLAVTMPVRLANVDDVISQILATSGDPIAYGLHHADSEARFYLLTPVYLAGGHLYEITDAFTFSLIRTAALLLQVVLCAALVRRLMRDSAVGSALLVALLAALHLPTTHYAVLSYPDKWIGFSALLGGLHLHLSYLRRGRAAAAAVAGILFLAACLTSEAFLCYLPVFLGLARHEGRTWPKAWRSLLAPATAAMGYTAVYVFFALWQKSEYGGTSFSPDILEALNCLFRQTAAAFPGFELAINRTYPDAVGSWHKSAATLGQAAAATAWHAYLLAAAQAAVFLVHLARSRAAAAVTWPLLACTFAVCLLPNLMISVTVKYQIWSWHRTWPYLYGFYVYASLLALLIFATVRYFSGRANPTLRLVLAGAWSLLFASAKVSNTASLGLLRSWYNS